MIRFGTCSRSDRCFSLSLVACLATLSFNAQELQKADAEYLRAAYDSYRSLVQSSPYRSIPWQPLGPTNISGRATDIAVADRNGARRIYVGYATSGVWKTDDDGATWQAVFEHQASTSIGDVAVAPSNPDIVWVGTGEANLFRASMAGVGIYKSVDGAKTFTHSGLTDTQTIARIVVHPSNPDIVYVAASGHEWTDNEMRGVFKTTDGGRSWQKVFYRSPRTGAIDLVMDPADPEHPLCRNVAAYPQKVERPTHGARLLGRRCVEDDRWRTHMERGERRSSRSAVPGSHRPRRGAIEPECRVRIH